MEPVFVAIIAFFFGLFLLALGLLIWSLSIQKQRSVACAKCDMDKNPFYDQPDRTITLMRTTVGNPVSQNNPAERCMFSPFDIESAIEKREVWWSNNTGVMTAHPMLVITFTSGRQLRVNMSEAELEQHLRDIEVSVGQYTTED